MKHWRQDWSFEDPSFLRYEGHGLWRRHHLPLERIKGEWTQKVYGVDDGPRHEGSGPWEHHHNVSQWTSRPTNRPLPRRDYLIRNDYDVLVARNQHVLTPDGWVHEQNNDKLSLSQDGSRHTILVREIGRNHYHRINDRHCQNIYTWWERRKAFWVDLRGYWDHFFSSRQGFQAYDFLPGQDPTPGKHKSRHHYFFDLSEEVATMESYIPRQYDQRIRAIFKRFTFPEDATVTPVTEEINGQQERDTRY